MGLQHRPAPRPASSLSGRPSWSSINWELFSPRHPWATGAYKRIDWTSDLPWPYTVDIFRFRHCRRGDWQTRVRGKDDNSKTGTSDASALCKQHH